MPTQEVIKSVTTAIVSVINSDSISEISFNKPAVGATYPYRKRTF